MWRPKEGWENPYSCLPEHMEKEYPVLPEYTAFEAGADAMLEGLKKQAQWHSKDVDSPVNVDCQIRNGYLVFIPEESNA